MVSARGPPRVETLPASSPETDPGFTVVDGLLSVSVAHGLARITLAQAGPNGEPVPAGRIAVPLARLPAVAGGFLALMRKVEEAGRNAREARVDTSDGARLAPGVPEVDAATA